jgi:transcriptional regulator with XRE-family HTH domain
LSLPAKDEIGQQIRRRRRALHMSLQNMSNGTGLSISTLSKIENNLIELNYTRMIAISEALGINLTELMTGSQVGNTPSVVTARRSITRKGEGSIQDDSNYQSRYLNTDISKKQMIPAMVTVKHRTLEEFGPMLTHRGEELIVVLSGEVELHTEHYNPVRLGEGESAYIDSTMPHAILSVGRGVAQILDVCTHEIPKESGERTPATRPEEGTRAVNGKRAEARGGRSR